MTKNRNDMDALAETLETEARFLDTIRRKVGGAWFCKKCGLPINNGYSWNGLCVVCSEPYTNPEYNNHN